MRGSCTGVRALNVHKHHRKRRSQGGDDSYGNLIELTPATHELVHANPELAYQRGLLVHSYDDPAQVRPDLGGFLSDLGIHDTEGFLASLSDKPKRKNYEKDSEERRKRRRITVAVPNDTEDGGAVWDETQDRIKQALIELGLYSEGDKIPAYEAWIACANDWLNSLAFPGAWEGRDDTFA